MLAQCIKFLKALNSDAKPWQISLGLNLGLVAGLLPLYTPSAVVLIFIACILRINMASCLLAFAVFSGFAWMLDQPILQLGQAVLYASSLQSLFAYLYQSDFFLFMQFNHTQVMGAWVLAILLLPVSIGLCQCLIVTYRKQLFAWLKSSKIMKWLEMNQWYQRVSYIVAELNDE